MKKTSFIYIMTNKNRTTLYVGITNDLCRRIFEHKNHRNKGSFSDRFNLEYCIYFEEFELIDSAIKREKQIKSWSRKKKEDLINKKNPEWKEIVNENGFKIKKELYDQQVDALLNNLNKNNTNAL